LKNPELLATQYRTQLSDSSVSAEFELSKRHIALARKRVVVQEDRMTGACRNEANELDRFKANMQKLNQRRKGLEEQEESGEYALEHLDRNYNKVADGINALTFEERQQLLRLVAERTVVRHDSVRVETVIPSGNRHAGLLCTCHPDLVQDLWTTREYSATRSALILPS
jgi:hypothetical protein